MWHVVEPPLDATEVVPAKVVLIGEVWGPSNNPKGSVASVLCGIGNGKSDKWWYCDNDASTGTFGGSQSSDNPLSSFLQVLVEQQPDWTSVDWVHLFRSCLQQV